MDTNQLNIVLVAWTESKAQEARQLLFGDNPKYKVLCVHPGVPFSHDQFDCCVAYASKEREVRFLADQVTWYKVMPIFITVGMSEQSMTVDDALKGKLLETIDFRYDELDNKLRNSFNLFDKKNNGKISLKNLPNVVKQAGLTLCEEDFKKAVVDLDVNGDGRIFYQDFRRWWLSGHRGRTGVQGFVIKTKAALLRFFRKIQPAMSQIVKQQGSVKHCETDFSLNLNKVVDPKLKATLTVSAFGKEAHDNFQNILKLHPKLTPKNQDRSHHIWQIQTDQNPASKVAIEELIPLADYMGKYFDIPVSVYADDSKISIAIFWDTRNLGQTKFFDADFVNQLRNLGVEQFLQLDIQACCNGEQLLENTSEIKLTTLPNLLLQGLRIGVKTKIWNEFADIAADGFKFAYEQYKIAVENNEIERNKQMDSASDDTIENDNKFMYPLFELSTLVATLCNLKGHVRLNIDPLHYADAIKYNPFFPAFDISALAYLEKLTQTGSDDDTVDTLGKNLGFPDQMSNILRRFFSTKLEVMLSDGLTSASLNVETQGLHHILKHIIRVMATREKQDEMHIW